MTISTATLTTGEEISLSDSRIAVVSGQVFFVAGVIDDSARDVVRTHITFEGLDEHGAPADVTVRLTPEVAAELVWALNHTEQTRREQHG